ncbi:MAG: type II secretion system F family protein [Burkholderiaceae bacterium]|nr:type II secretion system F family protein [Burkholderiaceae bacterium]
MTTADLIALFAFLAVLLLGMFIMTIQSALRQRPTGRVRTRLESVSQTAVNPLHSEAMEDMSRAERDARRRQRREAMGWMGRYLARIETVSGQRGIYILAISTVVILVVTTLVAWLVLPLPWWGKLLVAVSVPAFTAATIYRRLNDRFRLAFLEQLPDILDMIIRASQAGIPVTQSVRNVGQEFGWPAGPEFQRIGDSLYLGNDMSVVFEEAEQRIQLPDFSFLSVCLLLQRETGGSLSETLSNLAEVVRARRDLRLKTRALTAEGRLAGAFISVIPIFILIMMTFINPEYISVFFNTETGHTLLMVAAGMLTVGSLLIRKISKLET